MFCLVRAHIVHSLYCITSCITLTRLIIVIIEFPVRSLFFPSLSLFSYHSSSFRPLLYRISICHGRATVYTKRCHCYSLPKGKNIDIKFFFSINPKVNLRFIKTSLNHSLVFCEEMIVLSDRD